MRFAFGDARDHVIWQKTTTDLRIGLRGLAALEVSRNRLSRDFPGRPIFDFFNTIGQKRWFDPQLVTSGLPQSTDFVRPARLVRFVPKSEVSRVQVQVRHV